MVSDLGLVDLDLRSSPGWWAASVASYCPNRRVEHPNSQSTQPRSETTSVTLYSGISTLHNFGQHFDVRNGPCHMMKGFDRAGRRQQKPRPQTTTIATRSRVEAPTTARTATMFPARASPPPMTTATRRPRPRRPCVGLCQYYRTRGKQNPMEAYYDYS